MNSYLMINNHDLLMYNTDIIHSMALNFSTYNCNYNKKRKRKKVLYKMTLKKKIIGIVLKKIFYDF